MSKQKRNRTDNPFAERNRFEERRLASSFLAMTKHLPARPALSQSSFENVASEGRARYRGHDLVSISKDVMRDAIATGDAVVMKQTAEAIRWHFAELERVGLTDYLAISNGDVSMADATERAMKEVGEAACAMVREVIPGRSGHEHKLDTLRECAEAKQAITVVESRIIADLQVAERRERRLAVS